eukprot:6627292-Ditylum_brightwellii.AAC.1
MATSSQGAVCIYLCGSKPYPFPEILVGNDDDNASLRCTLDNHNLDVPVLGETSLSFHLALNLVMQSSIESLDHGNP